VVGVAKSGLEEGVDSIGGNCIVAPFGEVVVGCQTKYYEMAIARIDLNFCAIYKRTTFNFDLHRQPHAYGLIVERKGETLNADGSAIARFSGTVAKPRADTVFKLVQPLVHN